MYFQISNLFVFLFFTHCCSTVSGQALRNGNRESEPEVDWEVARQNRITQQILQYYLERKLFPQLKRPDSSKVPSASDILSRVRKNYNYDKINNLLNATKRKEQETLQSVESETVTSVYDKEDAFIPLEEEEGMRFNLIWCLVCLGVLQK